MTKNEVTAALVMSNPTEQSVARLMFTLGGNAFTIIGTGFTTLGFIYLIHKATGNAISVIEYIPTLLDSRKYDDEEEDVPEPLFTAQNISSSIKTYIKIICLILVGVLMKSASGRVMANSWITAVERYIYSRRR